jgi:hypothetical protein
VTGDQRIDAARAYLTLARLRDPDAMPPSRLVAEVAELRRLLAGLLAVIGERQAGHEQLAQVRTLLAAFQWETDDRQLALEAIERITEGDE